MLSNPYYRRSVLRPLILAGVTLLAVYTLYNQAQLREHTSHLQSVLSEGIHSLYQANRAHNNTLFQAGTEDHVEKEYDFGRNPCAHFPEKTDGILLVLKTGATEVFDKLPTQLLTSLQCLPDFLLFSDREQQIGQWHIHNALDTVSEKTKADNPEFDLYRTQQQCPVTQKSCLNTYRGQSATAAWALDKYKFMHILERTWEMRPNQSYYLFAEADTYIVWPNLVQWLRTRSPVKNPLEEPLYVGSAAMLGGIPFAHGGSGYVLSGRLVRDLVEGYTSIAEVFDARSRTHCCGDQMIAKAVLERNKLRVQNAHPMFNGEKPTTFPYGPTHWCEPSLTMHHVEPEEVSAIWQLEQTRKSKGNLLLKDLYHAFVANKLVESRTHWDNMADDVCYANPDPAVRARLDPKLLKRVKNEGLNGVERDAHKSLAHCAQVCEYEGYVDAEADDDEEAGITKQNEKRAPTKKVLKYSKSKQNPLDRRCFQYRYHNGVCCTGRSFRLGAPRREVEGNVQDKPEDVWHSGWHLDHINAWIKAKGDCPAPRWKVPDKLDRLKLN
ncbi:hypothetical protein F5X68DRAFT_229920 [Plectosphaerella plurivora]|uniref:Uncharacterized protein n=1 Tax=Plectosphaerella plurivora TaxID=936078 RepID=A0A9P8VES5_9PEZI|nr:hypothetical protein F5X68DRAFT_229920 [Plectosphaerella plurivora]